MQPNFLASDGTVKFKALIDLPVILLLPAIPPGALEHLIGTDSITHLILRVESSLLGSPLIDLTD